MTPRLIAAVSITSLLFAAAPAFAQSQLPRPGQLPPAGGQGAPPQRAPAAQSPQQQPQQQPAAAAKPYKPVTISAPAAVTDPSFEAFRKQLGAIAEKKDRKALAGLVAQNFFWMGEKGDKADKKKSGLDNLAKAIQLDGKEAPGWEMLGAASADPTGTPFPDRKDTICAPADPTFNRAGARSARQGDRHRRRRLGLSDPDRPRGALRAAAQLAGGREARPALRARDAGSERRSRARCSRSSRRPARPGSCRPRR